MRIAILSLYTQAHARLNAITAPPKQRYADRWGYTFINHFGSLDEDRPPAWSKLKLVQRHLCEFDWVHWIDADATIINPDIRLEQFLTQHDLIIAQECFKSHFGEDTFNTGSFFLRNTPWSHRFLETVYGLEQFREHIYWDQAAIRHALDNDPDSCRHVFIETNPKRFNSFAYNYSKGDFVFHAVTFSSDVEAKEKLLQKTIKDDQVIPSDYQPDVKLVFLADRSDATSDLLEEFALSSVIRKRFCGVDVNMRVVDVTPDALCKQNHGTGFSRLRRRMSRVTEIIRQYEGQHVVFLRPDTQILTTDWTRRCLLQLGDRDGLFLENGTTPGELGDAFVLVRATRTVVAFFEAVVEFLNASHDSESTSQLTSFAQLVDHVAPHEYGCKFATFRGPEVQNVEHDFPRLEDFLHLCVHSTECVEGLEEKRKALAATREGAEVFIDRLNKFRLDS